MAGLAEGGPTPAAGSECREVREHGCMAPWHGMACAA
jgi:hypothetical protein